MLGYTNGGNIEFAYCIAAQHLAQHECVFILYFDFGSRGDWQRQFQTDPAAGNVPTPSSHVFPGVRIATIADEVCRHDFANPEAGFSTVLHKSLSAGLGRRD